MSNSPTTAHLGQCVVCGKASSLRCGECSKYGTDWIFFCSREHQKLIWFLHRRCCSINSKPFRFPDFSAKEAQSALEVLNRSRDVEIERDMGADLKRVEATVRKSLDLREIGGGDTAYRDTLRHREVFTARAAIFRLNVFTSENWGKVPESEEALRALDADFLNYIAWLQQSAVTGIETLDNSPFFDKFQHLFFVYCAFVSIGTHPQTKDDVHKTFREYAYGQWRRFVETEVRATHPAVAQAFLNVVNKDTGLPFPSQRATDAGR